MRSAEDVDEVALNYGSSDERGLTELSAKDAEKYMEDGQFGSDTMAPKIQAALSFLRSGKDRAAVITSQNKAKEAMAGKSGTWIRP